jgi:hypothetical protein
MRVLASIPSITTLLALRFPELVLQHAVPSAWPEKQWLGSLFFSFQAACVLLAPGQHLARSHQVCESHAFLQSTECSLSRMAC